MIGIVIVAHGNLAREYLNALEHVVGVLPQAVSVAIGPDDSHSTKQEAVCRAVDEVDKGDGVVVVTDMFGGTPSNLACAACASTDRNVLYGANLPMLIKLAKLRRRKLPDAVAGALEAGRKYINCAKELPQSTEALPI